MTTSQPPLYQPNYPARRLVSGLFSPFILVAISTLIGLPIAIFSQELIKDIRVTLPLTIIAEILAISFGLWIGWKKEDWKAALSLRKPKVSGVLIGAGLGVLLFLALQVIAFQLSKAGYTVESSNTSENLDELTGVSKLLIFCVLTPIVVPFIEELFFRGWVFSAFKESALPEKIRPWAAVILSSLFFALMHVQGFSTVTDFLIPLWITVIAVIQGVLMLKYKSLWVTFALHMMYNGTIVVMSFIAG